MSEESYPRTAHDSASSSFSSAAVAARSASRTGSYKATFSDSASQTSATTIPDVSGPYGGTRYPQPNTQLFSPRHANNIDRAFYNSYLSNGFATYPTTPVNRTTLLANDQRHSDERASSRYREELSRGLRYTARRDFRVSHDSLMSLRMGERYDGMVPMERFWAEATDNFPGKPLLASLLVSPNDRESRSLIKLARTQHRQR
jgi:hypothetical protein